MDVCKPITLAISLPRLSVLQKTRAEVGCPQHINDDCDGEHGAHQMGKHIQYMYLITQGTRLPRALADIGLRFCTGNVEILVSPGRASILTFGLASILTAGACFGPAVF